MTLSMLDKNGLIEIVGETVTVKYLDPGDVIITIPGEAAEEIIRRLSKSTTSRWR